MNISRAELDRYGLEELETPQEYSKRWIGYLRASIQDLENLSRITNVDLKRAVRGLIIGNIAEDAVSPLSGAIQIAQHPKKLKENDYIIIRSGWLGTWLASTGSTEEFREWLSISLQYRYEDIFRRRAAYTDKLRTNPTVNLAEFIENGFALWQDLRDVKTTDGFDPSDLDYSLSLREKL